MIIHLYGARSTAQHITLLHLFSAADAQQLRDGSHDGLIMSFSAFCQATSRVCSPSTTGCATPEQVTSPSGTALLPIVFRRCCHLASRGCKAVQQVWNSEPTSCIWHQLLQVPASPSGCPGGQQHLCAAECSADLQRLCSRCVALCQQAIAGWPTAACIQLPVCSVQLGACMLRAEDSGDCCTPRLAFTAGHPAESQAIQWNSSAGCCKRGGPSGVPNEQPLRCPSLRALPEVQACPPRLYARGFVCSLSVTLHSGHYEGCAAQCQHWERGTSPSWPANLNSMGTEGIVTMRIWLLARKLPSLPGKRK